VAAQIFIIKLLDKIINLYIIYYKNPARLELFGKIIAQITNIILKFCRYMNIYFSENNFY